MEKFISNFNKILILREMCEIYFLYCKNCKIIFYIVKIKEKIIRVNKLIVLKYYR